MTGTVSVHKRSLMCPCRWGSWLVTPTSGSTPLSVPGSNAGFSLPNADSLLGNRSVDCLDTQTTGVGYNLFAYTGNSSAEYVSACLWVKVGGSRVGVCACVLSTCFAGAADARPVMMRLRCGAGRGGFHSIQSGLVSLSLRNGTQELVIANVTQGINITIPHTNRAALKALLIAQGQNVSTIDCTWRVCCARAWRERTASERLEVWFGRASHAVRVAAIICSALCVLQRYAERLVVRGVQCDSGDRRLHHLHLQPFD